MSAVKYHFSLGAKAEAQQLVKKYHYSGSFPAHAQIIGTWHIDGGLFGDSGEAVAACVFALGARGWSESVLELVRLVRHPDYPMQLSGLISATSRICRQKGHDLLISYADVRQQHHGGIYQSASWNYSGTTKLDVDALIIDGELQHRRTANGRYGTSSVPKLREMGHIVTPVRDPGKHFYWKAMNKDGKRKASRLGFESLPYPKPMLTVGDPLNEVVLR